MQSIEQKFQTSKEREQKFWVLEDTQIFSAITFIFLLFG